MQVVGSLQLGSDLLDDLASGWLGWLIDLSFPRLAVATPSVDARAGVVTRPDMP